MKATALFANKKISNSGEHPEIFFISILKQFILSYFIFKNNASLQSQYKTLKLTTAILLYHWLNGILKKMNKNFFFRDFAHAELLS